MNVCGASNRDYPWYLFIPHNHSNPQLYSLYSNLICASSVFGEMKSQASVAWKTSNASNDIQTLHHMEASSLRSLFQHHFLQDMLKAEDRGKNLKTKLSAMTVGRWGVMLKRWFDLILTTSSPQLRCLSWGLPFLQKCVNIGVCVCVKNQVTNCPFGVEFTVRIVEPDI